MIRPEFQPVKLNERGEERAKALMEAYSSLINAMEGLVPFGRELSLAKTHLESSAFFAKRGLALDAANQQRVFRPNASMLENIWRGPKMTEAFAFKAERIEVVSFLQAGEVVSVKCVNPSGEEFFVLPHQVKVDEGVTVNVE